MPVYSYTCKPCERTFTKVYPMGKQPQTTKCGECNGRAARDVAADWKGSHQHGDIWPLHSAAAGINPDQRDEAMAADKRLGVPTEYDAQGDAVFTSPSHRRRYCEAHGLHDRNAGYSDPVPAARRKVCQVPTMAI